MKKAAQEEKFKQPKQSKDEMPPPASLQGPDLLGKIKFSLVSLKAFLFEPSLTNYFYLQLWASPVCVFFDFVLTMNIFVLFPIVGHSGFF